MIFLLDTNTISEPTRPEPDRRVVSLVHQRQFDYALPVTVWEELGFGIAGLKPSRRRNELLAYHRGLLELGVPILPFDQAAADWLAPERARLSAKGFSISYQDASIAAIAGSRNLTLVTRNTRDFKPFKGLKLANWFR